ncbi:hypothetical protein TCAL_07714 [Tigriopus californicus]|uniref:RING-type domain-containing protein n=1 Tax=Tigriopus californicus TaxID=6832 RepID=A0A553NDH0_TIGCA|nr:E3 ubiquitin-protein ligase RNF8-like [Tigriopus californicus]XP_059094867.1 E3 ubiquitin-protein ligase RNF8-like [Tigriopus californicus]TRY63477.1 hypothetical protein TCAL_07714 [Tigriopus californicus]|eukprot:TCALIF_07714-PA protein Name:"Similar to RNF8 E3 ubiquitin-protein ligase RNF8 (Pongo abelii)" AED:0.42 eAED:0.42 QI:0/-1/0/1/-1/1/1/0/409
MASSYHARRERQAPAVVGPTPIPSLATATTVSIPASSHVSAPRSAVATTDTSLDRWSRLGRHSSEELNRLALSPLVRRKRAHGQLAPHEQLYVTLKRIKAGSAEPHPGHATTRPQLALRSTSHASSTGIGPSASSGLMTKAGRSRTVPAGVTGEPPAPEEESRPVRSESSRPMTVRGRHFRERLRNAILDEDKDALRRRVRELESEKLALSDKVSQRKTKILQYKAAKLEQDTKYFRLATENARLKSEVKEAQRDKQVADQSHVRELKEVRLRLEAMKKKAEKAELERAKVESQLSQSTGGESFLQDILSNFKEMLETNLQCSICSEVLILSTTVSCGHTFCEDCIASWKEKTVRRWPTCPICRTVIDFQASNLVLDGYIDKVVETFFPEETRKLRADMLQDRRVKKTN